MDKKKIDDITKYPGMATDKADNETTTPKEVREEVRELNNNPRNNDMKMP